MSLSIAKSRSIETFAALLLAYLLAGCATNEPINSPGSPTVYRDPGSAAPAADAGIGIEANDVVAVTDRMTRDMLASASLAARDTPPRIILDSEYLRNESRSRVNKNLLTDRIRVNLNRASNGRMVFVSREFVDMVEKERSLKRSGTVDGGTIRTTAATAGADFRLVGRIASLDRVNPQSGATSRYHQLTFEMLDLELGVSVWSGMYEFEKAATDDIIYR